jgi:hypothetical protein
LRVRLLECLLVIVSLCAAAALAEVAFALVGLRYVPLRNQFDVPQDLRVFAQSSKAGVIPQDPVMLLGDSYAQGFGDWLWESWRRGNGPFHSAHVINRLTGRDVITLGVGGAGSAEGIAAFPAAAYRDSRKSWYLRLPQPRLAVIYFYEGNDLNDNVRFLTRYVGDARAADLGEQIDRALAAYPAQVASHPGWLRHLPLLRFFLNIARRRLRELTHGGSAGTAAAAEPNEAAPPPASFPPNIVEVAGRSVELPAALQGPSLELSDEDMRRGALVYERSLAFLQKLLPDTPVLVVYIPSPLASYRLHSPQVTIERYRADFAEGPYPRERVAAHSDAVCELIRAATIGRHVGFFDLRPAVRSAARNELLHGPIEFRHFNRKGMELLGREVAARIDRPLVQEACAHAAG